MTTTDIRRPRFDPELEAMLTVLAEAMPPTITPEMIPAMRGAVIPGMPTPSEILEAAGSSRATSRSPATRATTSS